MPEPGKLGHDAPVLPRFPELSRKPTLPTRERTLDPTLRDTMENGMEAAQAQFTRLRREWDISIDWVTAPDKAKLRDFVREVTGAQEFLYLLEDDPANPETVTVRFLKLPEYTGKDNTEDGKRFTCTFTLREF